MDPCGLMSKLEGYSYWPGSHTAAFSLGQPWHPQGNVTVSKVLNADGAVVFSRDKAAFVSVYPWEQGKS